MRIELTAPSGEWFPIATADPEVANKWMESMIPLMVASTDTGLYWRVSVYSDYLDHLPKELNAILPIGTHRLLDTEGALTLANTFGRLAKALREKEEGSDTQEARQNSETRETPTPEAT